MNHSAILHPPWDGYYVSSYTLLEIVFSNDIKSSYKFEWINCDKLENKNLSIINIINNYYY